MKNVSFIEVSHQIESGMKTYPGLPAPEMNVIVEYDQSREIYHQQSEFMIASLHLCGNTGTYVDSPFHRYRNGLDLARLPLCSLAHLPAVIIDASTQSTRALDANFFKNHDTFDLKNKAVLIHTGWSKHWRQEKYFHGHPFLTADACDFLIAAGIKFIGIDSLNIDDTDNLTRPAHTKFLSEGIPICEHMTNLKNAPNIGTFLHAVPIAWVNGATFPVRAYLMHFENHSF